MRTRAKAIAIDAKSGFNVNKLQAAACIVSSAAVSIGLIYWSIRAIFF